MNARQPLLALVVALALLGGACSGSDGGDGDTDLGGGQLDPDEVSRVLDSDLRVEAGGDAEFTHRGRADLRVVELNDPGVSTLRFFSIGLEQPLELDDGAVFRFAVDLSGTYDGAGTYEVPAAGETTSPSIDPDDPDPNAAASGLSRAFLEFNPEGNPVQDPDLAEDTLVFDRVVEPCRLEVGEGGRSGRLRCPELADAGGGTTSLSVTWGAA